MILDELERVRLDWRDLSEAGRISRALLAELAADRKALGQLVYGIESRPDLLERCERHRLLDKLVVYEALDRGLRVRVHLSTDDHRDRPHDHRFSFTSRILAGRYRHVRHRLVGDIDDTVAEEVQNDFQGVGTSARVEPSLVTMQEAGSTYTLHHSQIHTTFTTPGTVSLFLRGPSEKRRSLILERSTGTMWWRYGEDEESPERRRQKSMSLHDYRTLCARLAGLGIIG